MLYMFISNNLSPCIYVLQWVSKYAFACFVVLPIRNNCLKLHSEREKNEQARGKMNYFLLF
jgi:hypothetical protein